MPSSKWTAAALTTVLAAGLAAAHEGGAFARSDQPAHRPGASAGAPARLASDAPRTIQGLGSVGGVLVSAQGLLAAATPGTGGVNAQELRDRFTRLDAALRQVPANLPVAPGQGGGQGPALPGGGAGTPGSGSVDDALAAVRRDGQALVTAGTAPRPDQAAGQQAVSRLSADLLTLLQAVTGRLSAA